MSRQSLLSGNASKKQLNKSSDTMERKAKVSTYLASQASNAASSPTQCRKYETRANPFSYGVALNASRGLAPSSKGHRNFVRAESAPNLLMSSFKICLPAFASNAVLGLPCTS